MYEAFYGLREAPFRLTPDPQYLYLSPQHREALGHLLFGIEQGGGFVVVTGEIGTGKTTLLRTLLRDLEADTLVGYIFNPALSDLELLQTVNSEFGLPGSSTSKKDLVEELNRFLVTQRLAGKRVVIIVDEAQRLDPVTLEQLRLLSNLETETEKLLQIVLVGQPELREMLRRPDLAQLSQRITIRWHLRPLDRESTARYVRHRLGVAGGPTATALFTPAALRRVYRYSRGVPRLINIVSHRSLLVGFTRERRRIEPAIVRQATAELHEADVPTPAGRGYGWAAAGAGLAALAVGVVVAAALGPRSAHDGAASAPVALDSPTDAAGAADAPAADHVAQVLRLEEVPATPDETIGGAGAGELPPPPSLTAPSAPDTDPALGPTAPTSEAAADEPVASAADDTGIVLAAREQPAAAIVTAPPRADPLVDPFWDDLGRVDAREAARRAVQGLLGEWAAVPLQASEDAVPQLDLPAIAERRGLQYLATSGNLARLRLLNLPAILEVSLPDSGQRRFVVLAEATPDGGDVALSLGTARLALDEETLNRVWLGDAHLFWRDFEGLPPAVSPGRRGADVGRLQRLLVQIGEYRDTPTETFDDATSEAIARFQRSHRLVPDGIVGPLTKIVLYDALATYDQPRLSGGT